MKKAIIGLLFPNKCIACDEIINEGKYLCEICSKKIDNIDRNNQCFVCGREKDKCVCSIKIYHFLGMVSVFEKDGIAQRAYYSYKFGHQMQHSEYFARRMAFAVNKAFKDISFDYICSVPTSLNSRLKYGFDHCGHLSKALSQNLHIPYLKNVLGCRMFVKHQHNSSYEQRKQNVKGKYFVKRKAPFGTALLVDDIFTTGATMDECARMLLFAGAEKVYCVSVLISPHNKRNVEK